MTVGVPALMGTVAVSLAWGYVVYDEANAVLKARALRMSRKASLRVRVVSRLVPDGEVGMVLPARLGLGVLLGVLTYLAGANLIAAVVAAVIGAMVAQTYIRAREAIRQRRMMEQLPAFLSATLMGYLTEASLPRAVEKAAFSAPKPLGGLLRGAIASVRANAGGVRQTVGEVLWDVGTQVGIRPLQRLAHTLQQAEKGAAGAAVYRALEDIERELREDERLRRGRLLAARQSTLIVQVGAIGAGVLYVALALGGGGAIMRTEFGDVVTAASALLVGVSLLIASAAAKRASPGA